MKFYNRIDELKLLSGLSGRRPAFIVLTGKRRVGKTELIKQFIDNEEALYLFADDEKSSQVLLLEFEDYIKNQLDLPDYIRFRTYGELLQFLFEYEKDLIIAFDEFQRFLKIDPTMITQLQKQWDMKKELSNTFLITSGLSIGMIKKIFIEKKAPLFKRADNIITLKPFSLKVIFQVLNDLGIKDIKEKLDIFTLFGGTIYFYKMMERYDVSSFQEALDKLILNDLAPLRNEVRDVLIEEFGKKHTTYFEILFALATGKGTKKEIGDSTHVAATSLSPYLYDLIELLQVVDLKVPVTEKLHRTKKGRYVLVDSFFRFYFTFIYRNMSLYEIGAYEKIQEKIASNWNAFYGRAFERLALNSIKPDLLDEYPNVGMYWDRKGNEFDIVGINRKSREMIIIEVKGKDITLKEADRILDSLEERSHLIPYKAKNIYYGVVAHNVEGRQELKRDGHRVWELKDILALSK